MSFYQAMQLGASNLKPLIKEATDKKIKQKYIIAFIVKNILCLLFCMIIAVVFGKGFGEENSLVGVVTAMCILTFRFSNLDFNTVQSSLVLMGFFFIFAICPHFSSISTPAMGFIINLIALSIIVVLSCHNITLSNQSILIVSYFLLYGNPVSSIESYINRVSSLLVGGCIVAIIFYVKQRKNKFENTILTIINDINLKAPRTIWQLNLITSISTSVFIGELFNIPKTMWIAFSCMSIVQPSKEKVELRYKERAIYVAIGCIIYGILYILFPMEYRVNLGILGGFMVGMSATYHWQMVFNCFGALSATVGSIGLWWSIVIRVINNIFGSIYGKLLHNIFDKISEQISEEEIDNVFANM